ncbi:hypothetical protein FB566_4249 [Stackebrandtia endophytica]|uniref:Uncharacterized protein n=1 Tax=Stackebrandtia endophytica TaxID=1496996 RepID=A0A543B1F2_9ACTN|nr:hypothetical protein [Stackebrandtia endophytica]TQL78658.1 hypothetical protein FB566_4249 [Stackebrandtia endophytica]
MNLKLLAWITLPIVGLILAGIIVWNIIAWVFGWVFYLAIGVAAVGLAIWGWGKMKNKVGAGSQRKMIP